MMKTMLRRKRLKTLLIAAAMMASTAAEGQNKKLLGMTSVGKGIFEYDINSGALTAKSNFTLNPQDGLGGHGSLILASDGKIYGMTYNGGVGGKGVIFEYNPQTGVNKAKYQFDGSNGQKPYGSLCDAGNGKLYGMTSEGGLHNNGVIFEYTLATGTYTKLVDFKALNPGSNGGSPYGSLMKAANGKLYGMTKDGGDGVFRGVIFELNPANNQYAVLAKFGGGIGTGIYPIGDLVEARPGKLYGMARGGMEGKGCIFEFDIATNVISIKYYWKVTNPNNATTSEGANPEGSFCLGKDSLLYGLTKDGGTTVPGTGSGVIFTFNPNTGEYIKKKSLDPALVGSQPRGTLMQASNGLFYGMVYRGGMAQNQYGGIFEYDAVNDTVVSKHFFNPSDFQDAMYGKLLEISAVGTGIKQEVAPALFSVFPNPASRALNIKLEAAVYGAEISILDIQGKVLLVQRSLAGDTELDITSLAKGIYWVRLDCAQGITTHKFIKN